MGYLERVFRATEAENRRMIVEMLPAGHGGVLVDLGSGDGAFTTRVATRLSSATVHAVELGAEQAARARERGIDVRQADLEAGLPFRDASADVVHANQVIEHVRHTDVFLAEIHRILAPGGLACISTNNFASWHNVVSLALGMQPPPAHVSDETIVGNRFNPLDGARHADERQTHLRLFTARALAELCELHGLRRVRMRTAGYYPLPPRLGRLAVSIDRLHGAFLIGIFVR